MTDMGVFSPVDLTADEVSALQSVMADARRVLVRACEERLGHGIVKHLRDAYKADPSVLWANPRAKRHMEALIREEDRIVRGFIRVACDLCDKFDTAHDDRPGVTYGDYLQEAGWAIYDAIYAYDGSNQFSTFVYWCVKNRLLSFVRSERQLNGVGKTIRKLRKAVRDLCKTHGINVDDAVARLRAGGEVISAEMVSKLKDSMFKVRRLDDLKGAKSVSRPADDAIDLRAALGAAKLSPLERELVEGYMAGDRELRQRIAAERVNPNTGNLYTTQRLSQIFQEACEKIRREYNHLAAA